MRRASYRTAVLWVARNDEPGETDAQLFVPLLSVQLIADLFEVQPSRVARDVVRVREREAKL